MAAFWTGRLLSAPLQRIVATLCLAAGLLIGPTARAQDGQASSQREFQEFDLAPVDANALEGVLSKDKKDGQFNETIPATDSMKELFEEPAGKSGERSAATQADDEDQCADTDGGAATVKACTALIEAGETDPAYYYNRGDAYRRLGNTDAALKDLTVAAGATNARVKAYAYYGLGRIHADMGAYEKALADFDTALATNGLFQPQNAHVHKSVVFEKLKDLDKALGELDKAVKVMPGDGTTYFNRGRVLALRGRTDDALADYTKAIKLDPDFAAAYGNRGNLYADSRDYDAAIADFDAAIRLQPKEPSYVANRGSVYAEMGQFAKALPDYEAAAKLSGSTHYDKQIANLRTVKEKATQQANRNANDCLKTSLDKAPGTKESDRKYELKLINDCAFGIVVTALGVTESTAINIFTPLPANPMGADGRGAQWNFWTLILAPGETPKDALGGIGFSAVTLSDFEKTCGQPGGKTESENMHCMAKIFAARAEAIEDRALRKTKEKTENRNIRIGKDVALCMGAKTAPHKDAVEACTRLIEIGSDDPNETKAKELAASRYFFRGGHYGKLGEIDAAIADFTKAIALAPDHAAVSYFNRGVAHAKRGDRDEALHDLNTACKLDKKYCRKQ